MLNINRIAVKTGVYLARELNLNRQKEVKIIFGMELALAAVIKTISVMLLAYLLGVLKETMVLVFTAGVFRLASGGEHCRAFYRCLVGGTLVFPLLGIVVKTLNAVINFQVYTAAIYVSVPVVFAIVWKYAPGDTENKRIPEKREKARYKRLSLYIASVFFIVAELFLVAGVFTEFVLAILTGLVWQAFTITPAGYRFIGGIDSILRLSK
ncbi:accessory gene regulator ArgB-like protein [Thermincola potens]|uniref:Accessory gene regulator B n=1 Tax=Thermincola potens (strain JR) TaxID=635013 RepID=D5XCR7_THEPJ|nr:accessory gene regulator B family protein [Thermincola potens]ADG83593.1 Accessory gene regulator B [Thermincola potens JR]